jgi:hypothetical protein
MGPAELATPAGRERLDLCAFKVPVGRELVSMCEVNALGARERYYATLAAGGASAGGPAATLPGEPAGRT